MAAEYFSKISNDYRADKNNLETAAKEFARQMSNRVGHQKSVTEFGDHLTNGIELINAKYPRCKPLEIYKWTHYMIESGCAHRWSVDGVFQMSLYPVNESPYPKP